MAVCYLDLADLLQASALARVGRCRRSGAVAFHRIPFHAPAWWRQRRRTPWTTPPPQQVHDLTNCIPPLARPSLVDLSLSSVLCAVCEGSKVGWRVSVCACTAEGLRWLRFVVRRTPVEAWGVSLCVYGSICRLWGTLWALWGTLGKLIRRRVANRFCGVLGVLQAISAIFR